MAMNTATAYVIGNIWQPNVGLCAQSSVMRGEELDRLTFQGRIDRDEALEWADIEFGDFREIVDIAIIRHASNGVGDLDWQDEESEMVYNECTAPKEDED